VPNNNNHQPSSYALSLSLFILFCERKMMERCFFELASEEKEQNRIVVILNFLN
jgi:hypothetical protein